MVVRQLNFASSWARRPKTYLAKNTLLHGLQEIFIEDIASSVTIEFSRSNNIKL